MTSVYLVHPRPRRERGPRRGGAPRYRRCPARAWGSGWPVLGLSTGGPIVGWVVAVLGAALLIFILKAVGIFT
jgi:hypothetical protein